MPTTLSPSRTVPLMLASERPGLDADRFLDDDAWAVEEKIAGRRCAFVAGGGRDPLFFGRDGQTIDSKHLIHAAKVVTTSFADEPNVWFFDGELVDRVLVLFDVAADADGGTWAAPYHERRCALDHIFGILGWEPVGVLRLTRVAFGSDAKHALVERGPARPAVKAWF